VYWQPDRYSYQPYYTDPGSSTVNVVFSYMTTPIYYVCTYVPILSYLAVRRL
jgi:hypothetical protein